MQAVESKVKAGAVGGGAGGGVVAPFLLWLLGVLVWHAPDDADHVQQALNAVPGPVALLVWIAVPAAGSFAAAYAARHTPRPTGAASPGRKL